MVITFRICMNTCDRIENLVGMIYCQEKLMDITFSICMNTCDRIYNLVGMIYCREAHGHHIQYLYEHL